MQQQKLLNRWLLLSQQHCSRQRSSCVISVASFQLPPWSIRLYSSSSSSSAGNTGGFLDKRLRHEMPHRNKDNYYDQQRWRRRVFPTIIKNDSAVVDPNFIWEDYHERYTTLPHGTSFSDQRKHEDRWNWRVLLTNFLKTSPVSLKGAAWHALYASIIITPHQIFHQDLKVQQAIAKYWAEDEHIVHLPWNEMVNFMEPFVKYHDMVSGDLLAAFSIYSTAMFFILSMRLTGAINYQREGHQSYTDLTVEVLKFTQKTQLYCTSKQVSVELSVWAYSAVRAAELHLQNIQDPASVKKTLEGIHLQTTPDQGGEQNPPETKELPNTTTATTGDADADATKGDPVAVQQFLVAPNKPIFALQHLTLMCRDAFDKAYITNIRALIDIQNSIGTMTDAFQRCVQIQAQPEPYSVNLSMKFFLQVWVGFLPLVLVPTLHLCTIPMSTALALFVYKLDEISAEMQNPYGHDASDIAISTLGDRLQYDLSQMLVVYDPLIPSFDAENAVTSSSPSTSFPTKKYSNSDEKNQQQSQGEPAAGDWADDEKLIKRVGLGTKLEPTNEK